MVLDVEILQAVFLERGREEGRLLADQLRVGVEVFGDAGEEAPRRGVGGQVVGLDGQLDVQDLGVGAKHVPRHVDLDERQFVIDDLQDKEFSPKEGEKTEGETRAWTTTHRTRGLQLQLHLHQAGLEVLPSPLQRNTQRKVSMSGLF